MENLWKKKPPQKTLLVDNTQGLITTKQTKRHETKKKTKNQKKLLLALSRNCGDVIASYTRPKRVSKEEEGRKQGEGRGKQKGRGESSTYPLITIPLSLTHHNPIISHHHIHAYPTIIPKSLHPAKHKYENKSPPPHSLAESFKVAVERLKQPGWTK